MRQSIKHFMTYLCVNGQRPALGPAKAASLTLRVDRSGITSFNEGRLCASVGDALVQAIRAHGIEVDAAVYSYATPIAFRVWLRSHNCAGKRALWIIPRDRYSTTTTRHQNTLRATLGLRMRSIPRELGDIEKYADVFGVEQINDIACYWNPR